MRLAVLVLILVGLAGCDDAIEMDDGLEGEWERVGFPECEGTIPLQDLPLERRFIYATEITVEQDGDYVIFNVDGRGAWSATLEGNRLHNPESFGIVIDSVVPLPYYNVLADRYGRVVDDGARMLIFDSYRSMGDYLNCTHIWERR